MKKAAKPAQDTLLGQGSAEPVQPAKPVLKTLFNRTNYPQVVRVGFKEEDTLMIPPLGCIKNVNVASVVTPLPAGLVFTDN